MKRLERIAVDDLFRGPLDGDDGASDQVRAVSPEEQRVANARRLQRRVRKLVAVHAHRPRELAVERPVGEQPLAALTIANRDATLPAKVILTVVSHVHPMSPTLLDTLSHIDFRNRDAAPARNGERSCSKSARGAERAR